MMAICATCVLWNGDSKLTLYTAVKLVEALLRHGVLPVVKQQATCCCDEPCCLNKTGLLRFQHVRGTCASSMLPA